MARFRMPARARAMLIGWAYVAAAIVLGLVVPRIDTRDVGWVSPMRPDEITSFLSSVSSGMMAFTGIVFAIMFIVLQFGSTAYSPHVVTQLTRNPYLVHSGGVFTGTFLYSLGALRGVGGLGAAQTSPLPIWVALAWLFLSVFMLMHLVGVFASLEISEILYALGDGAHRKITRLYEGYSPAADEDARRAGVLAPAGPAGQVVCLEGVPLYLLSVDVGRLVALAQAADAVVVVPARIGDCIPSGAPLALVYSTRPGDVVDPEELRAGLLLERERSREQGPANDLRLLVDIAIRALSPAINDPTTAVHALDQIESVLCRLGNSHLENGRVRDGMGTVRLAYSTPTWREYLDLAVVEIQQYGSGSVQVERRLAALFNLLRKTLPEARRPAIDELEAERLATIRNVFPDPLRRRAELGDRQGLGHAARGT